MANAMNRTCGSCTLCCKLLPVPPLNKVAGQRCQHQRATGCRVYRAKGFPVECGLWSCTWLINDVNDKPVPVSRPDRSHYVIDSLPDYVTVVNNETGERHKCPVIQIWCDPDYPDAHRDPALRNWLDWIADTTGNIALVRFSSSKGMTLIAPSHPGNNTGGWIEGAPNEMCEPEHDKREVMQMAGWSHDLVEE